MPFVHLLWASLLAQSHASGAYLCSVQIATVTVAFFARCQSRTWSDPQL